MYLCSGDYLMEPPAAPAAGSYERNLEAVNAFAARHTDLRLNMAVIPNAACILADKLPKNAPVRDQSADLTALAGSLQGISFLDVSAALSAHTDEQLYYRTDHHWTSLGARYAFEAMAEKLGIPQPVQNYDTYTVSTTFEGTLASRSGSHAAYDTVELYVPQTDVEYYVSYGDAAETSATIYDRSALDQKDKYTVFFGGNYPRVDVYTTAETGIRAQPLHTASGRDVGNHRGDGAPGLGRQRLHDHPVSAPERAPLALRATDLAALPVRQRRPARHDDLLFQPQTSAPTLPHITY